MTDENSGTETGAPRRQRMGVQSAPPATVQPPAQPAAPAQKRRTGGAIPPKSEPAPATGAAAPVTARPTRTRMGSPLEVGPVVVPSASVPAANVEGVRRVKSRTVAGGTSQRAQPGRAATSGRRPPWVIPVATTVAVLGLTLAAVLGARWLRTLEPVQGFIAIYDGHSTRPDNAPVGLPAWLGWQHFFNMFLMVLIVRTGLQVRNERKPPAYWTAKKGSFFSPKGNTPKKVSLTQWLHQSLDVLWVLNGLIFVILLLATGQWMRIVPTSWDIFPNMLSAGVQYASLDWPTENGWVHYNALQVMAYFLTVFVAAPLAVISGVRMSTWWPEKAPLGKLYPVEWARAVHVPVMVYFLAFTAVHVFLVFFTGALRNLNHMFASRDEADWWGLGVFGASMLVIAAAWFLTKPLFITPLAGRTGKVSR